MREYIVNLTNNLIGKHGLDLVFVSMRSQNQSSEQFIGFVEVVIGSRDVREMSPGTLGEVMCSFERNELPAVIPASFFGDPAEFLRSAVSRFLAYSIRYRLDDDSRKHHDKIPPYGSKK